MDIEDSDALETIFDDYEDPNDIDDIDDIDNIDDIDSKDEILLENISENEYKSSLKVSAAPEELITEVSSLE